MQWKTQLVLSTAPQQIKSINVCVLLPEYHRRYLPFVAIRFRRCFPDENAVVVRRKSYTGRLREELSPLTDAGGFAVVAYAVWRERFSTLCGATIEDMVSFVLEKE